ncbi:MAG: hypothetical protein M3Y87_10505, partial [Myxococcota bacterium]|nr:hypothetical protein [Myxococcota bacterium]
IAGSAHACAATDGAIVSCWGANDAGQIGLGTIDEPPFVPVPTRVEDGDPASFIQALAGGADTTCVLRGNSSWTCWGSHWFGQLGDGMTGVTGVPTTTTTGLELVDLSGASTYCGIARDGAIWCWGYNARGQLGRGVETHHEATPGRVGDRNDWRAIDADGLHTCAIRNDDTLWCWGYNDSGELGLGHSENRAVPERPGCAAGQSATCFDDWASVANGEFHTCALRRDGSLWCWGGNGNGQLGLGMIGTEESAPRRVGESRWTLVEAGPRNTCAIAEDGSLWCWGPGSAGQIGDGARETRSVPSRVLDPPSGERWEGVAIGAQHTCGIRSDRSVWCWGANAEGQLGIGAATEGGAPTARRVCLPAP